MAIKLTIRIAALVLTLIAESVCSATVVVTPHGGNSYTIQTQYLTLNWNALNNIALAWNAQNKVFANLQGGIWWPYTNDISKGDSNKSLVKLSMTVDDQGYQAVINEVWSVMYSGVEYYRITMIYTIPDNKPYFRVRIGFANSTTSAISAVGHWLVDMDSEFGNADRAVAFHQRMDLYPLDFSLGDMRALWGTLEFGSEYWQQSITGSDLFLPVECIYSTSRQGGPVLMCEPRNWFAFFATSGQARANRRFWIPAGVGQTDNGIDVKDGTGVVPYELVVGYCDSPHWAKLYWDYYVDAFPRVAETERPLVECHASAGNGANPPVFSVSYANTLATFGVKSFGNGNILLEKSYQETNNCLGGLVSISHQLGRQAMAGFTHGMAVDKDRPDSSPYLANFDYRNYPNDLVHWRDGSLATCWVGYRVNPSLDEGFRFQSDVLQVAKDYVNTYGYDGFGPDYYLDIASSDWAHPYAQYPFHPLQVSYTQFAKTVSDWLHDNGKAYFINYPHPSLQAILGRFADMVSYDGPVWQNGFIWKMNSAANGQRVVSMNGPVGQFNTGDAWRKGQNDPALFFGTTFSPWNWQIYGATTPHYMADQESARFRFASNSALGDYMSVSKLVTGDRQISETLGQRLFFKHADGTVFASVRNLNQSNPASITVAFDLSRLGLSPAGNYSVWKWDYDEGLSIISDNVLGSVLTSGVVCPSVPAGGVKIVVVRPYVAGDVVDLGFCAYIRPLDRSVESSSGISQVQWDGAASELSLTVNGVPMLASSVSVHVPTGVIPIVTAAGAMSYTTQWIGRTLGIIVNHNSANVSLRIRNVVPISTPMGLIRGKVTDLAMGNGLNGVKVTTNTGQWAYTDSTGAYCIDTLPGSYILTAVADGYTACATSVTALDADDVVVVNMILTRYVDLSTGTMWSDAAKYSVSAFASDSDPAYPALNSVNNNTGDWWQPTSSRPAHWLMIDLGQVRTIKGVSLIGYPEYDLAPADYRIQIGGPSADPSQPEISAQWQDVAVVTNGSASAVNMAWGFSAIQGQRVRCYVSRTNGGSSQVRIRELMVFSDAAITLYPLGGNTHGVVEGIGYSIQDGPQCATDGDPTSIAGTYWNYYPRAYHLLDIGPDASIRQIVLRFALLRAALCQRFRVQVGGADADPDQPETGSDWSTVAVFSSNYSYDLRINVPDGIKAQRVRIYCARPNTQLTFESIDIYGARGEGASLGWIADAKKMADGAAVRLSGKTVSAVFSDRFYIEDSNRTSGIMVRSDAGVAVGDVVEVLGTLNTLECERCLEASFVAVVSRYNNGT